MEDGGNERAENSENFPEGSQLTNDEDPKFSLHSYCALSCCFSSALEWKNVSSDQPIQKRELRRQEKDGSFGTQTLGSEFQSSIHLKHLEWLY